MAEVQLAVEQEQAQNVCLNHWLRGHKHAHDRRWMRAVQYERSWRGDRLAAEIITEIESGQIRQHRHSFGVLPVSEVDRFPEFITIQALHYQWALTFNQAEYPFSFGTRFSLVGFNPANDSVSRAVLPTRCNSGAEVRPSMSLDFTADGRHEVIKSPAIRILSVLGRHAHP
jgi:hypothetical protein